MSKTDVHVLMKKHTKCKSIVPREQRCIDGLALRQLFCFSSSELKANMTNLFHMHSLPGLDHVFVYNDSHQSLNRQ